MSTTGYSGTPLVKKLGIKENFLVKIIHPPDNYFDLLIDLPEGVRNVNDRNVRKDFIHYFTKESEQLFKDILELKDEIKPGGMIWISWPKKAAKIQTDITEDVIRDFALKNGLVDVKVCAVDDVWSGLKLVIPVKLRG